MLPSVAVEEWLAEVEERMHGSVRACCVTGMAALAAAVATAVHAEDDEGAEGAEGDSAGAGSGGGGGRARWVTEHAAMVVLLANSVAWTRGVEAAILCGQVS